MKKLLSCLIIGIVVLGGLGAAVTATDQNQKNTQRSGISESPYDDELDQSMTDYDGSLPLGRTNIFGYYANLSIAQSFIPQMEILTRTFFLMARNASTSHPCVLAIRDNLTKEDLSVVSIEPSEFPIVNGTPTEEQLVWIEFNFNDIWVTPGQTYYIVVYTANVTDNYYWISGNGTNIYPNGTVYLSTNDGQNWTEFPGGNADGCFKTYGLHETFLQITMKGGFGPSFIIKNIGNYTAWDVTLDSTVSGGFVFIGKHLTINVSELQPNQEITVRPGLVIGFGKVTISLQVSAANVKEMSSEASATLLLFFLLGIK
ncbi:MAG: hypothetical protein NTY91_07675 [Euryarchaeota archaeon]|nr:hypothetical protein [Euryarchaeota archaeon]